jgi:hypothetical protein
MMRVEDESSSSLGKTDQDEIHLREPRVCGRMTDVCVNHLAWLGLDDDDDDEDLSGFLEEVEDVVA